MPAEGSLALLWRFTNAGLREEKSRTALAAFMEILDTTIVNVALRYIAGDLRLAWRGARPQTLFPDLHRHVHGQLAPLWDIHQSRGTHRLPTRAGLLRRRPAAQPAIDHP